MTSFRSPRLGLLPSVYIRRVVILALLLCLLCTVRADLPSDGQNLPSPRQHVSTNGLASQHVTAISFEHQHGQVPLRATSGPPSISQPTLSALVDALEVMQSHFFELWQGTWPRAIDWTAAVLGTHVSASLIAITTSKAFQGCSSAVAAVGENLVNRFFSHSTSFYFGEDAFSLRNQAYDDMLWVVLGWLESVKFVNQHSDLHYSVQHGHSNSSWYGKNFIPAFGHRARIFWDLASKGWDTSLCGGGMIWSPYLTPYKNAITNELYISASVGMYLYFPGDRNSSPFMRTQGDSDSVVEKHDPRYLYEARRAYKWLKASNMTNSQGLYVDGFHIRGWRGGKSPSKGTGKCDVRNEMVYTYNQGVILSGQRGLWESTGQRSYLEHGHKLVRDVITATGWHETDPEDRRKWHGIGRNGILEEFCDASGSCSQNGQTFKGIFFHHLSIFCSPLRIGPKHGVFFGADPGLASIHRQSCQEYGPWVALNAQAAKGTVNTNGEFGMWWTIGLRSEGDMQPVPTSPSVLGTDYMNNGVPYDDLWRYLPGGKIPVPQRPELTESGSARISTQDMLDPNDRGRGRTVETQSGGVAILRALHSFVGLESK